jgi:hypothetical protein
VTIGRGLDRLIGFIALIHSTRNCKCYSTIADLHTLQVTFTRTHTHTHTHTRVLSHHWSYPGNGFQHSNYISLTVTAAHKVSRAQPSSFLAISSQSSSTAISRVSFNSDSAGLGSSLYSLGAAPTENTVS